MTNFLELRITSECLISSRIESLLSPSDAPSAILAFGSKEKLIKVENLIAKVASFYKDITHVMVIAKFLKTNC